MSLPNYVTLFRILLCPVFFTLLVSYEAGKEAFRIAAIWVFVIASISDAVDGFLARFFSWKTRLGAFLDPLADKLLLLSGYLGLLFVSALPIHPPLWVTVTIVFRDLVIVFGMAMIFLMTGEVRSEPNVLGKITTFFQMITLIAILLLLPVAVTLCYITAVLTIFSGVVYAGRELKHMGDRGQEKC